MIITTATMMMTMMMMAMMIVIMLMMMTTTAVMVMTKKVFTAFSAGKESFNLSSDAFVDFSNAFALTFHCSNKFFLLFCKSCVSLRMLE